MKHNPKPSHRTFEDACKAQAERIADAVLAANPVPDFIPEEWGEDAE